MSKVRRLPVFCHVFFKSGLGVALLNGMEAGDSVLPMRFWTLTCHWRENPLSPLRRVIAACALKGRSLFK